MRGLSPSPIFHLAVRIYQVILKIIHNVYSLSRIITGSIITEEGKRDTETETERVRIKY